MCCVALTDGGCLQDALQSLADLPPPPSDELADNASTLEMFYATVQERLKHDDEERAAVAEEDAAGAEDDEVLKLVTDAGRASSGNHSRIDSGQSIDSDDAEVCFLLWCWFRLAEVIFVSAPQLVLDLPPPSPPLKRSEPAAVELHPKPDSPTESPKSQPLTPWQLMVCVSCLSVLRVLTSSPWGLLHRSVHHLTRSLISTSSGSAS